MIISVGLMTWNVDEEKLKEKRGKRIPIRVSKDANFKTLPEIATSRFYNFHLNICKEDKS